MDPAKTSVLVVDSNLDTLSFFHSLLKSEGYRVSTFSAGVPALRYAWDHAPEQIFVASKLEREDGLAIVRALRALFPKARICVVLEWRDPLTLESVIASRGDDVLVRPLEADQILRRIQMNLPQPALA